MPQNDFLTPVMKQTIDTCSQESLQGLFAIHSLHEVPKDKE